MVLGNPTKRDNLFAYRTIAFSGHSFQSVRLKLSFVTLWLRRDGTGLSPTTPHTQRSRAWHVRGLGCSPFARRYWGNRGCFLFLRVLRWFTSPGSLPHPMDSDEDHEGLPRRVSPFGDLRIKACLTAPRSLSQLATSFVAFLHLGILRVLLVT